MSEHILLSYVAAPHGGYLKLFRKYAGETLCILGDDLIQEFPQLTRHLPGVLPQDAATMVRSLGIFSDVRVVSVADLSDLAGRCIVMPDEDVAHAVAERHLPGANITYDGSWKLRWDLNAALHHRKPEGEVLISTEEMDRALMAQAADAASRSPDWWRQVGGLLARDGEVLLVGYNDHMPSDQTAYVLGDPRSNFNAGEHIDLSLALHAEIAIITAAAERGLSTKDCDLYVTTFPCPPCAYAVANSGIKRIYYRDGYSLVAGADSLRANGVEMFRVE
jgi:dCMP deaminase